MNDRLWKKLVGLHIAGGRGCPVPTEVFRCLECGRVTLPGWLFRPTDEDGRCPHCFGRVVEARGMVVARPVSEPETLEGL